MQTDADIAPRRRARIRMVAVLAVAAAVVVAGVLYATLGDDSAGAQSGSDTSADRAEAPDDLAGLDADLTERVLTVLEDTESDEHAGHDHHHDGAGDDHHAEDEANGLICEARAFGHEPQDAESVDEVEQVYAQHFCAQYGPGEEWPRAITASGPVAVDLTTDPATVTLPDALADEPDGDTHAERIRMLVPEEYHDEAFVADGYGDPELGNRLRDRFQQVNG